ncbi:MAG: nucleotide pyrophosphohydrolase [Candidatus Bathyarchaeota archaeon]|nr:nucleotide pyrophosphohydrolase [Candidatus Bathyarchaeota archaeon]
MVSIRNFQNIMRRLYFHRDSKRGTEGTYQWLREEVDELGEALAESNMEALAGEFADVAAWLASLANLLKLDLETALLQKYGSGCPKCSSVPCRCSFITRKS